MRSRFLVYTGKKKKEENLLIQRGQGKTSRNDSFPHRFQRLIRAKSCSYVDIYSRKYEYL